MPFAARLGIWGAVFVGTLVLHAIAWRRVRRSVARPGRWMRLLASAVIASLPTACWALLPPSASADPMRWSVLVAAQGIALYVSVFAVGGAFAVGWRQPPPEVTDAELVARVAALASAQRIPVPTLRRLSSSGGPLGAQAWATGLVEPVILVMDGILHRLRADERDAIIAHELGHLANGSLWTITAMYPLAGAVAIAASALFPPITSLAFGAWFFVGARRLASRLLELDCDRRAARCVGHAIAASAVEKIHATHAIREASFRGLLVYATATHPAPSVRLRALHRDAVRLGRQEVVTFDRGLAARLSVAAWIAAALWLGVGILAVVGALDRSRLGEMAAALLMLTATVPSTMIVSAGRADAARASRRMKGSEPPANYVAVIGLALTIVGCLMSVVTFEQGAAFMVSVVIVAAGLVIGIVGSVPGGRAARAARGLRRKAAQAWARGAHADVTALATTHAKILAHDAPLAHDVAFAQLITGDRDAGLASLRALRTARPRFAVPALTLAAALAETDPEEAIAHAEAATALLPRDGAGYTLRARALRRLGRRQDAERDALEGIRLNPRAADAVAVLALVRLDAGAIESARESAGRAAALAPGDAWPLVALAEVALARGDSDAAAAVAACAAAAEANPFAMARTRASELVARVSSAATAPQA